jgi:hypothetical protein
MFATAAALLLVVAIPLTDEVGFAACALFLAWHLWRSRGMPSFAETKAAHDPPR